MGEESEAAAGQNGERRSPPEPEEGETDAEAAISEEQFADLAAREEFVLSVTEKGFGERSSAYDYRITGRGGQGINNMDLSRRSDAVVAVFPIGHNDQIMLVTDGGMVIRVPVHDIRIAGAAAPASSCSRSATASASSRSRICPRSPTRTATANGERATATAAADATRAGATSRVTADRNSERGTDDDSGASGSIPARSTRSPTAISTSSGARCTSSITW